MMVSIGPETIMATAEHRAREVMPIRFLSPEEGRALFDRRAQELLGMSGDEFLRRCDAGEFDHVFDDPDHPEILDLYMLTAFAR
jgi:hypothetical protein